MDITFILINGIVVASIYGLVAVAVSITWSSLGLLNLGYGFIFSLAGYGALCDGAISLRLSRLSCCWPEFSLGALAA